MAGRRKRNIDYGGKSYNPEMIEELREIKTLMVEMTKANDNYQKSQLNSAKVMDWIEKRNRLDNELKAKNIKLTEQEIDEILKLADAQRTLSVEETKRVNNLKQNKQILSRYGNAPNTTQQNIYSRAGYTNNFSNNSLAGQWLANRQQKAYDTAYSSNLKYYQDIAEKMGRDKNSELVQRLAQQKTVNDLKESGSKYQKAASIINVAAKTFNDAVLTIWNTFMKGSDRQLNAYEDTFENISVRNGTTRSQYYNAQIKLNNQLSSLGVRDNVATSEVQKMWNTWATNGVKVDLSNSEQTASAIETVITQHIVPYLDVTSKNFTLLSGRLGDNFVKNIRGINEYSMQTAENSYLTGDLMQEIIDQVQPMSDEALQNLTQGSAEFVALINKLTPQMGEKAAKEYATQIYKMQNYSDQVARNGTVFEKDWLFQTMNSPYNLYNPLDWNNIAGIGVDTSQTYTSWLPGYTSTTNGLVTNVGVHSLGLTTEQAMGAYNLTSKGMTGSGIASETDMTPEEWERYVADVTGKFENNQNQTKRTLQETWLENASNELTAIREQLGIWEKPITTLLSGIGNLLKLWIGSKLIGGIFGKGGATFLSGVGSTVLGTIGPALGVGAAVVGVGAAVNGIYDKIVNGDNDNEANANEAYREAIKQGKSEEEALKIQANEWLNTATTKHETASGALREGITNANASDNWFDKTIGNTGRGIGLLFTASAQGIGDWVSRWGKSGVDLSAQNFKNFNNVLDTKGVHDKEERKWQVLSWLLLAYAATQDESNLKAVGVSKSMLAEYLKGMNKQQFLDKFAGTYMQGDYYAPQTPEGKAYTKLTDGDMNWLMNEFNIHRQGLDTVPYDNYPAMLHEGEAVLTATTANELRNLLDEYRQTSRQAVNFDTIIQQQTSDLIYKMDEIISTINGVNVNTANYNENQGKALVRNSMTRIKSTKSF